MSLLTHVRKGDWEELEDGWTELMLGDASIAPVLEALPHAARRREIPRITPLLREHAEILSGADRAGEAAELLGTALLAGASPGELAKLLFEAAEKAWSEEVWWASFCDISGFIANAPDIRAAWRALRRLMALKDGQAVYHAKGWGIGAIENVSLEDLELDVRFATGRRDRFPFSTAVAIFEVLDAGDPRALVVLDPEGLARMVKDEPLELLRAVVRRHGGSVAYPQLKMTMALLGVEGTRFSGFWRKARKLADESGWFEISGAGVRVQVKLNVTETDPAEALRRQLRRSVSLADALRRVRDVLSGKGVEESLRDAALEVLTELAQEDTSDRARRLASWMLIRDARGATPPELGLILAEAEGVDADDAEARPPLWELFHELPTSRDQERAVELLQEVRGDGWLDDAALNLLHAPPGMARPLVDALAQAGRGEELNTCYANLLLRPTRNPQVLISLANQLETAEGVAVGVSPMHRAVPFLQLAAHLKRQPSSNTFATRARMSLTNLLTGGSPPLLVVLLGDAQRDDLRRMNAMVERGMDREIDRVFTNIVLERAPEIFRGKERPFWETDAIWTTRDGLARREEELRLLVDVKIPANSEAIGKAASFGDLSENSEWDAALEEQRNLTSRAQDIEMEIRIAELIEDVAIPEGLACPGTQVTFTEAGQERTMRILGPWDTVEDDVLSYRSPLAMGLMGLKVEGRSTVKLPQGEVELVLLEVVPIRS